MSVPGTAELSDALVALIGTTGRPVGDGRTPTAADPPFAVVYTIVGSDFWGPAFAAPQSGAAIEYQVTSVDVSRAGAEAFADTVRHLLLDRADGAFVNALTVPGLVVLDRELASYGSIDHDRGVFNVADQYRIHVTL